eukprot:GCRY01001214.1.p1 GENE.GCRY01001214.1~~GCRY01001214.1.p1  ORF type:complete len:150 (+),score=40.98 GCRY01001214.1:145-594(+)
MASKVEKAMDVERQRHEDEKESMQEELLRKRTNAEVTKMEKEEEDDVKNEEIKAHACEQLLKVTSLKEVHKMEEEERIRRIQESGFGQIDNICNIERALTLGQVTAMEEEERQRRMREGHRQLPNREVVRQLEAERFELSPGDFVKFSE